MEMRAVGERLAEGISLWVVASASYKGMRVAQYPHLNKNPDLNLATLPIDPICRENC
jgi:hypothetical protein